MPVYTIKDNKTGHQEDVMMAYSELERFLKTHPNKSQVMSAPRIVSGVAGQRRPDEGFRDVLRNIKKNNRRSTMNVL